MFPIEKMTTFGPCKILKGSKICDDKLRSHISSIKAMKCNHLFEVIEFTHDKIFIIIQ